MADKYTFMLPCDMLLAANEVANSSRVSSDAGIGVSCMSVQKVVNFFHPAKYIFLVVGQRPRVIKCSAWVSNCLIVVGVFIPGGSPVGRWLN